MADLQIVQFGLNNEDYGLEITRVQEIVRYQKIMELPNTAEYIQGVINLRDKIIPVVDLKYKFFQEKTKINEDTRIIIIKIKKTMAGLITDRVSEVLRIPRDSIEETPQILGKSQNIAGIGKLEDKLVTILDLDNLLDVEEIKEIEEMV